MRFLRIAAMLAVAAGSVINPLQSRAEEACPWLNAATAGGVLGGEAQMSVTPLTAQGDTTCEFTRKQDARTSMLRIVVHTMTVPSKEYATYLAQCNGASVPLKGIGNEAIQCVSNNAADKGQEQVIGRVRDRAFVLSIRASSTKGTGKGGLSDETRNVAEQVAGALF
jgi:hypothetical protein